MDFIRRAAPYAIIIAIILALISSCSGYAEDRFDAGYRAGYEDCEEELRDDIEEDWYDAGYSDGYSDAEYDLYDARFTEGYEAGYSDGVTGENQVAKPRGDDYVWFSFVGEDVIYHKYTLPLPPCATAQSADGYYDPIEEIEEDYIPCSICFPNK